MFSILFIIVCLIINVENLSIDLIENNFNNPVEKLLLINSSLFVGTTDSIYHLSSLTLKTITQSDYPNTHWKIFLSLQNENLLICGTTSQGYCQIIDKNFNLILNSSLPIVANDQNNSTVGLVIPEENLIYFGVTYTNWQIPNICGRSLNISNFMKIVSTNNNNDDEIISRDDLSLRFMSRQQTKFLVQYIYSFYTENYIYFISNQPDDIEQKNFLTKILRFCRSTTNSIIHTYIEIPLICTNTEWIIYSGEKIVNQKNQEIFIGYFKRKDGLSGTKICVWNIQKDIDKALEENYRRCYAEGRGQRGLAFIKPNEPCRKDETWSIPTNDNNICPWIVNERLPYPVGGTIPILGRLFYENLNENTSAFKIFSYNSLNIIFQGLTNGTFKLGLFDIENNINWFYSYQFSVELPILSDVIFDNQTATIFLAIQSKIFRLSFQTDCTSRLSCDECLSSSNNPLCGWCTMNQRCTLVNHCSKNLWQQENNKCVQIVNAQPLKAAVDNSQWINLTLSKLPSLEHNEIYQCIFKDNIITANTQAIKLDHNRLSCPTPSKNISIQNGSRSIVRLSVIKWPSNINIAIVPEFTFYNCSSYSSCVSCRSEIGCQWCSQRCSSICNEPSSQCPSFTLLNPTDLYLESNQSVKIPLKFHNYQIENPIECHLNETIHGYIDSNNLCTISNIPQINNNENNQKVYLTITQNEILIGNPIEMYLYRCEFYDTCDQCNSRQKCSWCQGRCSSKLRNKCTTNEQCTSLRIKDFSPKILPFDGKTIVTIDLNENFKEKIRYIYLIDIRCVIIKLSADKIECQSDIVNSSRKGQISIEFENSIYILSKDDIEYRQTKINTINPMIVYELGGQIIYLNGENLFIGNQQKVSIGNYQCLQIKSISMNSLSCRLPAIIPDIYNISMQIDQQFINTEQQLKVTPNPIVQDIDPTISFASGGRLVTIRGMYFGSAQTITVKFSHKKWNAKLKILSSDIITKDDEMASSFSFRTPGLPSPSNEFPSPPFDVNFSIYFDNSIIPLINLIQFRYIPDVLLNISSIPPTLPYTGEELKLQVENLTEAASIPDIQLLIGCSECHIKTFTAKGITCQPPTELKTNTEIILNNQQQDDCTLFNSSIGPIRFRIGYREYLIGYLSYTRPLSSKTSLITIIFLIFASCLLTIAILTLGIYLYLKYQKTKSSKASLGNKTNSEQNSKQFWSTDTSASTCPYYQVYEQISSISSHNNTLTRAPLLLCPYYQEKRCTPPIMEQLQMNLSFLTTLSIENDQLKKLFFSNEEISSTNNYRSSMELFYDLLNMKPFSQVFIEQLIKHDCSELLESYIYLFRYTPQNFSSLNLTRQIRFFKFFSKLFLQTTTDLINKFHLFDDFLRILIDLIDISPTDELLNCSMNSISSPTLLLYNIQYQSFQLTIDYENFFRFHISVLDCDTINQVKQKIIRYLNSYENTYRIIGYQQIDLLLPPLNTNLSNNQIPMLKNYVINSTICCQKVQNQLKTENKNYDYHLCKDNQFIYDDNFIEQKLIENKNRLQQILIYFYQQIANGLDLFAISTNDLLQENKQISFQQYIQLVSDLIRRLNRLMLCRSTCPIIESCLNVVADGLEFIFDTKAEFSKEIELLFMDDKKYFSSSFDPNNFRLRSTMNSSIPNLSSIDIRSLILSDDNAIECLFKLYQFYEVNSEPINQHIGENHVSVLLPVHHLLVQIRQLLQSDQTTLI